MRRSDQQGCPGEPHCPGDPGRCAAGRDQTCSGDPRRPGNGALGPLSPRDPRDVLASTPAPTADPDPRIADGLDDLLDDTIRWLGARIGRWANETGLAASDIEQELRVGLLRSSKRVDPDNPGVRTWLARRIRWTVLDLLKQRGSEVPRAPETLAAEQASTRDPDAGPEEMASGTGFGVAHLMALGLSRNQAEVIALRCSPHDIPLKEFAQLVRRSAPAVRQDLHRGLRRLEGLFHLTTAEAGAIRAWRLHHSTDAAAAELGLAPPELRALLDDAHKKIDRLFADREGQS